MKFSNKILISLTKVLSMDDFCQTLHTLYVMNSIHMYFIISWIYLDSETSWKFSFDYSSSCHEVVNVLCCPCDSSVVELSLPSEVVANESRSSQEGLAQEGSGGATAQDLSSSRAQNKYLFNEFSTRRLFGIVVRILSSVKTKFHFYDPKILWPMVH